MTHILFPLPQVTSPSSTQRELELDLERSNSRASHLRSQNEVLSLALDESKSTTERLSVLLAKYESNNAALNLTLNYCDHMVESYDVLVALLETEADLWSAADCQGANSSRQQAASNRRSAETVARHLLSRMDKTFNRSDSGHHTLDSTWEDSSGYSHTTR